MCQFSELLEVISIACFHPFKGFPTSHTKEGKVGLKIMPYSVRSLDRNGDPTSSFDELGTNVYYELPCGHCAGCRADQAKEWSDRLIMEMKYHDQDSCYFITLTYDDAHLHRVMYTDKLTGELKDDRGTLSKRDIQLFMKRLRREKSDDSIRFYICGEYGPQTQRPHYHGILFGLHLGNWHLVESGHSETGNIYYSCGELERVWTYGFVSIEPANEFTCKYVCQYVTKKLGAKPDQAYTKQNLVPPFSLMSRKPGIGRLYYDEKGDEMFKFDKLFIATSNGSVAVTPPRYFKKLYRESHPDDYQAITEKHLRASYDAHDAMQTLSDLDREKLLAIGEDSFQKKLNNRNKL